MPTSPQAPLLQALDALWGRLRSGVPDLPPSQLTLTPEPARTIHGPERWTRADDGLLLGLAVPTEMLEAGARATVEHVLHEAAHVLCWVREIKDTTMRGAYHNASYLAAAEEVGLQWPEGKERIRGRGYSEPELSDAAAATYASDIAALSTIIPNVLSRLPRTPPPAAKRPDRLTLECGCKPKPRQIRVAQTVAALGPIQCGVCGKEFTIG